MTSERHLSTRLAFGLYEADLHSGELWKAGRKVRLQSQPFKVLAALLEHPGEVVTRTELQTLLWGKDLVGEFDQSLGTAVNKIRDALGDHADNPRFVETLARRGYRFIAPVTVLESVPPPIVVPSRETRPKVHAAAAEESSSSLSITASTAPVLPTAVPFPDAPAATKTRSWIWTMVGAGFLAAFALGIGVARFQHRDLPNGASPLLRVEQLTHIGKIAPGMPGMESLPASASDGLHIFVPVLVDGRSVLSRVDVHTGAVQPIDLPHEVASPMLGDLSPDLSTLLLRNHLSPESEQPLWLVPAAGGSALRLPNVTAHDATWMPDGKSILYAVGNQLIVNRIEDGVSTSFATLPGRALWLRWSPDGSTLRFTLLDPLRHTMRLWQINSNGKGLRTVLDGADKTSTECCGVWADGGRSFVFQANRDGHSDIWRIDGKSGFNPVRVTDGPLDFAAPVADAHGSRIYFLGLDAQSKLQRYDAAQSRFVQEDGFLSDASRLEYSRDHNWVLWVDQSGRAWRAHADGTEQIQLTSDSLQVFTAHWSPNGQQIAMMAREPNGAWQIYVVSAEGGNVQRLNTGLRNAADPSWSADGTQIVFGRLNDVMGNEGGARFLEVLDLRTGVATPVPDSTGMFSPRWSPDGHYIAALSLDQNQLLLYEVATKRWKTLAKTTAADPVWASNSQSIYFHASLAETQPIYRVSIPDGRLQEVTSLTSFTDAPTDYFFSGLSLMDAPIVRSRTATGDLYTLDLKEQKSSATR
jgi:Tol biopolymer transport system component/DNA-binding winged helix-turn-helix (wHTH) protein